jgi:hypothetical protein
MASKTSLEGLFQEISDFDENTVSRIEFQVFLNLGTQFLKLKTVLPQTPFYKLLS